MFSRYFLFTSIFHYFPKECVQTKCVYDQRMFAPIHSIGHEKYNDSSSLAIKNGNETDPSSDKAEEDYFKIMQNMNNGNEKMPQKKNSIENYPGQVSRHMI